MDPLTLLLGFASEISIRHVLALNLMGYMIKCFLTYTDKSDWTDIIPIFLGVAGVTLSYIDTLGVQGNFIVYGLANAGLAWLLHQTVKRTETFRKHIRGKFNARFSNQQD